MFQFIYGIPYIMKRTISNIGKIKSDNCRLPFSTSAIPQVILSRHDIRIKDPCSLYINILMDGQLAFLLLAS